MGWTVLYIAFGIVALWLLGEVLLQYKARLRWRLLAFAGFLGVVLGVLIPSVVVIGLGAAAFAVGQTYVTLSFRSGFASGWAVTGRPGASKRRRGEPEHQDPTLQVSDLQATDSGTYPRQNVGQDDVYGRDDSVFGQHAETAAEATSVYEPQPLPDDTGQYGVYNDAAYAAATDPAYAAAAQTQDPLGQNYAYDGYSGYDQQQYGYDTGQQQYAAYSDPYIGTQTYDAASYGQSYDTSQQQYTQQGYTQDPYATGSGTYGSGETPPGGVWMPQQRTTDDPYGGELPPEQPYPYDGNGQDNGHGGGYDEQQYRY
ncbi:SCO2102 family sporulation regulator [Streptomyces sp. 2A115]|uniref:SCO2102 family sporulation regulator n=1 Tax=Streptomyces sp. 2A115 TaxID=3457439 RepID=UPI003FD48DB4